MSPDQVQQVRQVRDKVRTIEHRLNDPSWNAGAQYILWSLSVTAMAMLDALLAEADE